ncbi:MAG: signal peptidase I [Actinomycetota bacterium]|nr:signal peptidase I [Actinomycetota bacterium]
MTSGGARRPFSHWPAVIPEPATAPMGDHEEKRRSLVRELPVLLLVAFLIAFGVKSLVAQAFFIPSESMESTLKVGDRVLVSRISYRLHDPNRGDVVVFTSPFENGEDDRSVPVRVLHAILESIGLRQPSTEDFIKRVIGLPGETVEGRDGKIFVDGRELIEPYLNEETVPGFAPRKVPKGKLWVMGDNRNQSQDARVFGPIDEDKVIGRAILRIWPIPRAGFL